MTRLGDSIEPELDALRAGRGISPAGGPASQRVELSVSDSITLAGGTRALAEHLAPRFPGVKIRSIMRRLQDLSKREADGDTGSPSKYRVEISRVGKSRGKRAVLVFISGDLGPPGDPAYMRFREPNPIRLSADQMAPILRETNPAKAADKLWKAAMEEWGVPRNFRPAHDRTGNGMVGDTNGSIDEFRVELEGD